MILRGGPFDGQHVDEPEGDRLLVTRSGSRSLALYERRDGSATLLHFVEIIVSPNGRHSWA